MTTDTRILYVTGGERQGRKLKKLLEARYALVLLTFELGDGKVVASLYRDGKAIERTIDLGRLPRYPQIIVQWLWVLWLALGCRAKYGAFDLAVCEGIQFMLLLPFCRWCGVVRKCVYYAQDWFPDSRRLQTLDAFCTRHANAVWNISASVAENRTAHVTGRIKDRAIVIEPVQVYVGGADRQPESACPQCVYLGGVRRNVGLDLAIGALAALRKEGHSILLKVVGPEVDQGLVLELQGLAVEQGVGSQVLFLGFLPTAEMLRVLGESTLGLALFPGGAKNYSNVAAPGKIREYLESGLPVVLSATHAQATELEKEGVAVLTDDSVGQIARAIAGLCLDFEKARQYRARVAGLAEKKSTPAVLYAEIDKVLGAPALR